MLISSVTWKAIVRGHITERDFNRCQLDIVTQLWNSLMQVKKLYNLENILRVQYLQSSMWAIAHLKRGSLVKSHIFYPLNALSVSNSLNLARSPVLT